MSKYIKWLYIGCVGLGILFVLSAMIDATDRGGNLEIIIGGGILIAAGIAIYMLNRN